VPAGESGLWLLRLGPAGAARGAEALPPGVEEAASERLETTVGWAEALSQVGDVLCRSVAFESDIEVL
jgi:hypothetical protein